MAGHRQILLLLATVVLRTYTQTITPTGTRITIGLGGTHVPVKLYANRRLTTLQNGQGVVTTLEACLALCVIQTSASCKGVDFNPSFSSPDTNCWLHNTCNTQTSLFTTQSGYTHYKLTEVCDPVKRVVRFGGRRLSVRSSGVVFAGADSATACGLACSITAGCVSADYLATTCTLFSTTSSQLPNQQCLTSSANGASTMYTVPCIPAGDFSSVRGGITTGVTVATPTTSDFFTCLSLCSASAACLGFRYSTEAEFDGDAVDVGTRCQHYVSTPLSNLCAAPIAATNIYTAIRSACRDLSHFFITSQNTNYISLSGISLVTTISNSDDCGIQCVESSTCAAFVFNSNTNQCYHNNNEVHECETASFTTQNGVAHSRLYSSCRRQEWDVRRNSNIAGVTAVTAANLEVCMAQCLSRPTCRAVVWNLDARSCSLQLSSSSQSACQVVPASTTCCYTAYRKYSCAVASGFDSSRDNVTLSSSNIINNVNSEEACLVRCQSSSSTCRAAVYHRDTAVCRLHIATISGQNICTLPTSTLSNSVVHYAQSCELSVQFEETLNQRVVGGVRVSQYQSLQECQRACLQIDRCVGLDWNKESGTASSSRCWLHYESNGGCDTGRTSTCCDHYQRTPNICSVVNSFYVFRGSRRVSGGTLRPFSVSGYTACLSVCTSDASCEGFDVSNSNRCTTYRRTSVCGALTTCTDCNHYRRTTFECMWRFRNSKKSGGSPQTGISSVVQCEQQCHMTSGCQGFDFDTNAGTPCFLHTASSICTSLQTEFGVQHYRLRTIVCTSDSGLADQNWSNAQQNFNTIGNELLGGGFANSAIGCLRECRTTPGCHGVDYDKASSRCYMARRGNACGSGNPNTCCDRLLLPNSCSAPPQSGYSATNRQHRLNGRSRANMTTLAACAAICTSDPDCAAFDYDRSAECWTHSWTNECRNEQRLFTHDCCDHYLKTSGCSNYNIPSFNGYRLSSLTHVHGGTLVPGLITEQLCVDHCTNTFSCHSVDFNFQNNECFVHTRSTGCRTVIRNPRVHRYWKTSQQCP